MIFKVSEEEQDSTFVESMYVHNISEEILKILKEAKQPALPHLYSETFEEVLSKMPEEIQEKVRIIEANHTQNQKEISPEDMQINFEGIVKLLQYVASVYKKLQKFRNDSKFIQNHINQSLKPVDVKDTINHLHKLITTSNTLISNDIGRLKKEYSSIKTYVKSIHDSSIYHSVYTAAYNKEFFFSTLANDISTEHTEDDLHHGVLFLKLSSIFIQKIKTNTQAKTNNAFEIELNLINKNLSIAILHYLRKMDYLGVLKDGIFIATFKNITIEVFETFIANMIHSINKTNLFTSSSFIDLHIGGVYLDTPNTNIDDIKKQFSLILKRLEAEKSKKYIIEPVSKMYD